MIDTSRFGPAIQVLSYENGEYFDSHFINVVVVVFIFIYILLVKNVFLSIVNSFVRNKVYLLTYYSCLSNNKKSRAWPI